MGAGGARSLPISGAGYGSSPHVRKRKTASPGLRASDRAAELDRIRRLRGDRRAAALDVDADRMLIGASLRASRGLRSTWPKFSAATLDWRARANPAPSTTRFCCLARHTEHDHAFHSCRTAGRIPHLGCYAPDAVGARTVSRHPAGAGAPLLITPLRGEARVVDQLLSAIERLNYPLEKLDVIITVEAKDDATRAAITARKHRIPITVIPVPAVGPAAKPKALNVALPFARGTFTVIYDAEDRPERNQLRAALKVPACKRACESTPGQAGSHVISPPSMPGTSTYSFRSSPHSACHFRLAALQIISAQRRCAKSAAGTLTTSRKMPTSGCASPRLRMSAAGSVSGHAGSRAGCRRGLSICASHTGFSAS